MRGRRIRRHGRHRNPNPLVIVAIDGNGINAPQIIPTGGDEVLGMQCSGSHVQLLIREYQSNRLFTPLYTVRTYPGPAKISQEEREELVLPKIGPTAAALTHKFESFGWSLRAGGWMRGDWYAEVPQVSDRPNNTYEVHFIHTDAHGVAKLVVTLLEETIDKKKKITQSVPLVHLEVAEVAD